VCLNTIMQKARGDHCIKKILTDIPSISSSWELLQTNLNDWKQWERETLLYENVLITAGKSSFSFKVTVNIERGETIQTILSHSCTLRFLNLFKHIESVFTWSHWCGVTNKNNNKMVILESRYFKFEYFFTIFLQLAIQIKVNRMSFWRIWSHHQDLKFRQPMGLRPLWTWGSGYIALVPHPCDRPMPWLYIKSSNGMIAIKCALSFTIGFTVLESNINCIVNGVETATTEDEFHENFMLHIRNSVNYYHHAVQNFSSFCPLPKT
jgi:hypothetical protein